MRRTVVIGVGNPFRRDDGVGRHVARRLAEETPPQIAVHESTGEALSLMELWGDADRVFLIDATEANGHPGTVFRHDASAQPLPSDSFHTSTHAFSVAEAVEMARSLGMLPPRVIVYGVEGADFDHGDGLSPEVERGAGEVLLRIRNELTP